MRSIVRLAIAACLTAAVVPAAFAQANDQGRLYGRVVAMDGSEYQGFLRWDNNEGHWTDQLDATKRLPRRFMREAERLSGEKYEQQRAVRVLGIRVGWDTESRWTSSAASSIRYGHIRQIQVLDDTHGLLVLKSGEEQELSRSSSDLGRGLEVIVQDGEGDTVELRWNDIDYIDFMPAPPRESPFGKRLYGTLTTRGGGGNEFTGWITWDRDEIFGPDELNGVDGRRSRFITFDNIAVIERVSSSRALATTVDGRQVEMSGNNDVNSENRGIFVSDPGLGRLEVKWGEFRSVRFHEPPSMSYDEFDGGRRLRGTVFAEDGDSFTGTIRWDNDEQWTWETLNGDSRNLEFHVEFGLIASIERASDSSARVTLLDGRQFVLRGSNDVNDQNRGIFVRLDDGKTVMLDWDEFDRVEFRN
jgi:hypothetical protein